jgi:hypothetical protein
VPRAQPDETLRLSRRRVERANGGHRHLRVVHAVDHEQRPRGDRGDEARRLELGERAHRDSRGGRAQPRRPEREVRGQHAGKISRAVDERDVAERAVERSRDDGERYGERRRHECDPLAVHVGAAGEVRAAEREGGRDLAGEAPELVLAAHERADAHVVGQRLRVVERERDDIAEVRRQGIHRVAVQLAAVVEEHRRERRRAGGRHEQPPRHRHPGATRQSHAIDGVAAAPADARRFGGGQRAAARDVRLPLGARRWSRLARRAPADAEREDRHPCDVERHRHVSSPARRDCVPLHDEGAETEAARAPAGIGRRGRCRRAEASRRA